MLRTLHNIKKPHSIQGSLYHVQVNEQTSVPNAASPRVQEAMAPSVLFRYVIAMSCITCLVVLMVQLYGGDFKVFFPTLLSGFLLLAIYILHEKGHPYISYYLFLGGMNLLLIYMVVFGNSNFQAIYAMYLVGMIFTFIYFKKLQILKGYMVISLISQMIIMYYNSDANINGIDAGIIADVLCLISTNIVVFLMCYFYLINLEEAKVNLNLAAIDLKKQQKELKERSDQLGQYIESNIQLENYTHLAAHELKSPLKAVKGFADILKDRVSNKLDDREKEMFSFISDKTHKMEVLLNDLNSLGKVSQAELNKESINLDDLFKDILIDRTDIIKSNRATLEFDLDVKYMVGQYGLVKQLFSNLIGNALKFVDGFNKPVVKVSSQELRDEIVFTVSDNGIGIKPEYRNKIFQIFERLHTESDYKGSGIGLSICKKIVDLHQGTINVQDSELGGSCFVVKLPKINL